MPFDAKKAQAAIDFFEKRLRHAVGRFAGHPFILAPWQRSIVREIFGTLNDDGFRQYRTLFLSTGKKQGKTAMSAGLALQGLTADREAEPHCYSCARTRDQAGLAYNAAKSMVGKSAKLRARCLVRPGVKRIIYPPNEGFYAAISADAGSWDGVQPSRFIADEIHRWGSNRDLWDVLDKGTSTRQQPLGIAITTAGVFGVSELCWEFHEQTRQVNDGLITLPTFYGKIFATPLDWPWTEPGEPAIYDKWGDVVRPATGWYAANPALGDFLSLDRLIEECKEARTSPQKEQSFKRFRLNQWIQHEQRWIELSKWDLCKGDVDAEALRGEKCHAGLDLATRKDLAALVLVFPREDGHYKILPFYWLPKEYDVNRAMLDRVWPWIRVGLIEATEGPVIDFGRIRQQIYELGKKYKIESISFDPFNASSLVQELRSDGFEMFEVRQGFLSMSEPTKQFESLILERRLEHGGHPVLRWNVDCCAIKSDNKDNIFPVKPHRERSNKRIDGVPAAIMALDRCIRQPAPEVFESVYETRGVRTL